MLTVNGPMNCMASCGESVPKGYGETPFMLAYGLEAMLPTEVALHTHRLTTFQEELNNEAL